jgi:hypothetical protein
MNHQSTGIYAERTSVADGRDHYLREIKSFFFKKGDRLAKAKPKQKDFKFNLTKFTNKL